MAEAKRPAFERPNFEWATVEGARICIVGYGIANAVHVHTVTERTTKTQIVSRSKRGTEYRHRREDGYSVGSRAADSYGGTFISPTCQRPRKDG